MIFVSGCSIRTADAESSSVSYTLNLPEPDQIIIEKYGNQTIIESSETAYQELFNEIQKNWGLDESGNRMEQPLYLLSAFDPQVQFSDFPAVVYFEYKELHSGYKRECYNSLAFFPLGNSENEPIDCYAFGIDRDYGERTLYYFHYTDALKELVDSI